MFSESFLREKPPANMEIAMVIGGAFAAMRRNWLAFLILALFLLVPTAAESLFTGTYAVTSAVTPSDALSRMGWIYALMAPAVLFFQPVTSALIILIVVSDDDGDRPNLLSAMREFAPRLPWILLTNALMLVIVFAGLVLLVVPGVMAAVALSAGLAACVIEKRAPLAALSRSLELTRGQRWRLLGLFLLIRVIGWGVSVIMGLASMMFGFSFAGVTSPVTIWVTAVAGALAAVFYAACWACAYLELRTIKEGGRPGNVAAVFA